MIRYYSIKFRQCVHSQSINLSINRILFLDLIVGGAGIRSAPLGSNGSGSGLGPTPPPGTLSSAREKEKERVRVLQQVYQLQSINIRAHSTL